MKTKVSQAQNNWFVVKATWEFFLVYLSLVKVIQETKVFN